MNAVAPIRICDIGGWTDTWFAGFGAVFNIAVYPYVEVQIQVSSSEREPGSPAEYGSGSSRDLCGKLR